MNIFNSLGSNYDFKYVLTSLFSIPTNKDKNILTEKIKNKFGGELKLFYKGRHAIEAGLKLLGLPKRSYVAINGFTCFVVYKAIKNAGLSVEYLDIPSDNLNFSLDELQNKFSKNPKIKVVIIQNTLGYPSDIEKISKFCKKNDIILIEDLAHSLGGNYGDLICLSFSQDKIIDGVSGGALIIKNKNLIKNENLTELELKKINFSDALKDRLYPLFTYLIRKLYRVGLGKILHTFLKECSLLSKPVEKIQDTNLYGLTNWHLRMANLSFDQLETDIKHRQEIVLVYRQNIDKRVLFESLISNINKSSNIRFPIFVKNRESLISFLKSNGVYVSDIWYDAPIAPKKYLNQTDYEGGCPNSEKMSKLILNLPTHKNVSRDDAFKISKLINQWIKNNEI